MYSVIKKVFVFIFAVALLSGVYITGSNNTVPSETDMQEAYAHFLKGSYLEKTGKQKEAMKEYKEVIKNDSRSHYPYLKLAELNRKKKNYDKARTLVEKSLKIKNSAEGRIILARILRREAYEGKDRSKSTKKAVSNYKKAIKQDPERKTAYLELSALLQKQKRLNEALEIANKMVNRFPSSGNAQVRIARLYKKLGKTDKRIEALKKAIEENPRNVQALYILARYYENEGKLKEAAGVLERIMKFHSRNLRIKRKLGKIYLKLGKYKESAKLLREVLDIDLNNYSVMENLAKAYRYMGRYEDALHYYEKLIDHDSTRLSYRFGYAETLRLMGHFSDALFNYDIIEERLEKRSSDTDLTDDYLIDIKTKKAQTHLALKNYERCNEIMDDILTRFESPGIDVYTTFTSSLIEIKNYEKALDILDQGLEKSPNNIRLNMLKAEVLNTAGEEDKSEKVLEELFERKNIPPEALIYGSRLFLENGKNKKARSIIKRGLEVHPKNEKLLFRLGVIYEQTGKIKKAEKAFRNLLEKHPENDSALNYLGYMLIENERKMSEAVKFIKKAVSLDEDNPAYLDSLGWALYKTDSNLTRAKNLLERAVSNVEDPLIWNHLGDVYRSMKKKEKAKQAWQKALDLGIKHTDEIKEKIDRID